MAAVSSVSYPATGWASPLPAEPAIHSHEYPRLSARNPEFAPVAAVAVAEEPPVEAAVPLDAEQTAASPHRAGCTALVLLVERILVAGVSAGVRVRPVMWPAAAVCHRLAA